MRIDPRYGALCASRLSWLVIIFAIYLFIYLIRQMAANSKIHNQINIKHSKRKKKKKDTQNTQHKSQ